MHVSIPSLTLKARPHIKSKMTVWKKTFHHLYQMFDGSGGGAWLNPKTNEIAYESEDWWKDYIKIHPYHGPYAAKNFKFHDDWIEIFGKDRATENAAEDISAAAVDVINNPDVADVTPPSNRRRNGNAGSTNNSLEFLFHDLDEGGDENGAPHTSTPAPDMSSPEHLRKRIKKEPSLQRTKNQNGVSSSALVIPPYVYALISRMYEIMDTIASKAMAPAEIPVDPASQQRKGLYNIMKEMIDITEEEEKIEVLHKFAHSNEDADVLVDLPEESRAMYLKVLLKRNKGKLGVRI